MSVDAVHLEAEFVDHLFELSGANRRDEKLLHR